MRLPEALTASLWLLLLIMALPHSVSQVSNASNSVYWNIDGDFIDYVQRPFSAHRYNVTDFYAPWGSESWGVFASSTYTNHTAGKVDEYMVNITGGIAHAWGREERRLEGARTGGVALGQGLYESTEEYTPPPTHTKGRQTLLIYKIMKENTSISTSLTSIDQGGILFDLFLYSDYSINGTVRRRFFIIDFYLHQECGPLNGACSRTNDTTNNHLLVGSTHIFGWKIRSNLEDRVWAADVADLTWYLENSVHRAHCLDVERYDNCQLATPEAYIFGLSAATEAFGGSAGFALDYLHLLQPNDCGTLADSGNNFNRPLRIDNLNPSNVTDARWLQLDGWLGNGSLYDDSDDYYQFEVTPAFQETGFQMQMHSEGSVLTELYAPGERPILKSYTDGVQTRDLSYNYTESDPLGNWYLHIRRSSSFGPYSLLFKGTPNSQAISSANAIVAEARCSSLPPATEIPWQLVIPLTAITVLILFGGRYLSRRRLASS